MANMEKKSDLLHIRVGKEMKDRMQKLIGMGMFSTEAEIAREGIRGILIRYLKEASLERNLEKYNNKEKNARKKQ